MTLLGKDLINFADRPKTFEFLIVFVLENLKNKKNSEIIFEVFNFLIGFSDIEFIKNIKISLLEKLESTEQI